MPPRNACRSLLVQGGSAPREDWTFNRLKWITSSRALGLCDRVLNIVYVGDEKEARDLESYLLAAFDEHCGGPCIGRETFTVTETEAKKVWCRAVSEWENGISGRGKVHLASAKERTKANCAK